jgi:nucleotide-binding universal stress UspA family protein
MPRQLLVLLVPLDGSPLAELALPHAAFLAKRLRARILLLRVNPEIGAGVDPYTIRRLAEEDSARAHAYLDVQQQKLGQAGLAAEGIIRVGDPVPTITAVVRERSVSYVVMTTHGRSGLQRALFGSVADGVIRESPVPVVVIRPSQPLPSQFAHLAAHVH